MKSIILFLLISSTVLSQQNQFETDLEKAYINAKKGVYYALENIPESKNTLNTELIDNDKLVAKVKLTKEVRGVKVESEGLHNSYEIKIVVYRCYDKLKEEGYIKYIPDDN
jgi:hypothetical protein